MAPSSSSTGAITPEDLKSIVNILEDVSDVLPAPASVIIKLVQRVIAAAEVWVVARLSILYSLTLYLGDPQQPRRM